MDNIELDLELENNQNKANENQINNNKEKNFIKDNININKENNSKNNSTKEKAKMLLQEKLKNIFLEREKAKLKYNKQLIPEQLKYTSDDEDSNFSKELEIKNYDVPVVNNVNNNEKKIEEKKENKNKNEEKNKNNEKKVDEVKPFKRKNNYNKKEEENKDKNLYQMLLSKKMKNIIDSDDEDENNNNDENKLKKDNNNNKLENDNDIELNKETEIKNDLNLEKNIKENKEEKEDEIKEKEEIKEIEEKKQNLEKEEKLEKKEKDKKFEKEENKENYEIVNNKEKEEIIIQNDKDKDNNDKEEKSNEIEENLKQENSIENKNIESEIDKETKYSSKTHTRNSGVIQLNQNINPEKNNSENEEKYTELPSPQKNKLTINLKSTECVENNDNTNKMNSSEFILSPKESKIPIEKPKTINRYQNNSKTIKEEPNNQSNIIKLLQLIKNKKNEREQIDKEKEKAKEEMCKRSKSQAVSRNFDSIHKFNNKSKEQNSENKEININLNINKKDIDNSTDNNTNTYNSKKLEMKSPKQEIYKKNKIKNNKYISNYKSKEKNFNINIKNVKNFEISKKTPIISENSSKTNSKFLSSNKSKDMGRIVVNHRMKNNNNINKVNINKINKNKNNENFKDVIKRYATTNISNIEKSKKRIKTDEMEINFKKPIYVYNRYNLQNRSMDLDNIEQTNNINNNISKKASLKKTAILNNNSVNVYNPKKAVMDKGNSVGKFPNNNKLNNNTNNFIYNYNYNNYMNNNNNGKNIYVKKKSFLIESNVETNTSSNNLSKSINNQERNKKHYSINKKKENSRHETNYYSKALDRDNSGIKKNLKVNKKSFYINDNNQNINNENENSEIIGRSFISDKNYVYGNKNNNIEKIDDKHDSYITSNNSILKGYNDFTNNNQVNKRLGLQKYCKNRKEILMDYDNEENKSLNNIKYYYYNRSNNKKNNEYKKITSLKIEDILIIEEKLNLIIECLRYNKDINKQCFDFWNYYFNSSIFKKIEKIFDNDIDINIAKLSINYVLISLIICYEYSLDQETYMETNVKLLEIMEYNYNNLMRLIQQIIDIMGNENIDNLWMKKLFNIYEIYTKKEDFFIYNEDILNIIEKIKNNNENISNKIQNLLNYYQTENNTLLLNYFLQLKTKTYEDLNTFFQKNILQIENEEGSLIASLYLRKNNIFSPVSPPYLKTQNSKKYTLVLDLDETLVNFKIKKGREGYVRLRPFLFGFLEEVSQYYELIIFTSATEAYANSVIEAIEHDKKYFDYIFYRQHTIIVGNDFVKDLTRIGRPLNSTIIIDNMPQNFRFQKENGICIKPFWGQDSSDKTLYDLMPILLDIAKNGGDVRISLNTYKDEIIGKISSNISKNKL